MTNPGDLKMTTPSYGLVGIGDNVVDHYLDQGVYYPGGNALNVAVLARRSGLQDTAYIGIIGNDEEGAHVHASLVSEGLCDAGLRIAMGETGKAKVTLKDGDRVFVGSNKGGLRKRLTLRLDEADLSLIARLGHVHSSCFSYLEHELPRIAAIARLSFDFSTGRDAEYFAQVCPYVTTAFLSGSDLDEEGARSLIRQIHALGPAQVCVTQGERGALFSDGARVVRQDIMPAQVVDTMGAGDAFIAGWLAATIGGTYAFAALPLAATAAARACGWPAAFGYPHPAL